MIIRSAFPAPLLAALLAGCAAQPAPIESVAQGGCDLKVVFASIGTGIDNAVLEKVDALLSSDTGVATIDRQRWGREGEITLCVDTRAESDANRLFNRVRGLFPASSEKPLSVETRSGAQFRVPAP